MLDRELKPGQLWSHYKHPDKLYEIKGVSVTTKEPVAQALYFAKKKDTLEDLGVYITSKGNLKLYYIQLTSNGNFKKILRVVREPHVIYQSKVDNKVWARLYDNFLSKVQIPNYYEQNTYWVNRFERVE